jgi:hypothetical protein
MRCHSVEKLLLSLKGNPITLKDFIGWIKNTQTMDTVSLKDAKNKWAENVFPYKNLLNKTF